MKYSALKIASWICGGLALAVIIFAVRLSYIPTETQINIEKGDAQVSFFVGDRFVFLGQCVDVSWQAESIKAIYFFNNATVGEREVQYCPGIGKSPRVLLEVVYPDDSREMLHVLITTIDQTLWFWGAVLVLTASVIMLRVAHPQLAGYLLYAALGVFSIGTLFFWLFPTPASFTHQANDARIEWQVDRQWLFSRWSCAELSWNMENISAVYYANQPAVGVGSVRHCPNAVEADASLLTVVYQDGTQEVLSPPLRILTEMPLFRWAAGTVLALAVINIISAQQWQFIYARTVRFARVGVPGYYRQSAETPVPPSNAARSFSFTLNLNVLTIIDAIWMLSFTALMWLNWQEVLQSYTLQAGLAVGWFLTPGIFLERHINFRRPFRPIHAITNGFVLSFLLGAGLFFYAANVDQSASMVLMAYWLTGIMAGLALIIRQFRQTTAHQMQVRLYPQQVILILTAALLIFVHGRAALWDHMKVSDTDYYIYNAFVTHFAESDAIMDREVVYGTNNRPFHRFLLSYWPANQAIMTRIADANIIRMYGFIAPYMVVLVMLSVYALARTVGFSSELSLFAVIAHSALFLEMPLGWMFPGDVLTTRLMQDKVLAAFLLAPILFRNILDYYRCPVWRHLLLIIVTALCFTFTHPTIMALAAIVAGFLAVLNILTGGGLIRSALVVVIIGLAMLPPLTQRAFDEQLNQSSTEVVEYTASLIDAPRLADPRRITLVTGTRFYGFNRGKVEAYGFGVFLLASLVAVSWSIYPRAAKLLAATSILFLLGYIPYTGWIIGLFVTRHQIVRIPWLMPVGIAAAYLAFVIWKISPKRLVRSLTVWLSLLGLIVAWVGMSGFQDRQERVQEIAEFFSTDAESYLLGTYTTYEQLGEQFAALGEDRKLVLAEEKITAWLPAISGNTFTLSYLNNQNYWQGGLTAEEAASRTRSYDRLISPQTSVTHWNELMQELNVNYIVVTQEDDLYQRMQTDLAPYVQETIVQPPFTVYRYQP